MKNMLFAVVFGLASYAQGQNGQETSDSLTLPYAAIPDAPKEYSAGTVASRVVDGLGFRYYWATEGLEQKDLQYKPNEEARSTEQTLDHILQLTSVLRNAVEGKVNAGESPSMTFQEKRAATLENIEVASAILRMSSDDQMADYKLVFARKDGGTTEFPFWNMLNGPLADAIWHVGQVVSFRRSSGNPFNSKVSVLNGRLRK